MPDPDPQGFVEKFTRVWAGPQPEEFAERDGDILEAASQRAEQARETAGT
jgi:hypothetical protein